MSGAVFLSFASEALGAVVTALQTHVLPVLQELWAVFHDSLWPMLRDVMIPLFIDFATRITDCSNSPHHYRDPGLVGAL